MQLVDIGALRPSTYNPRTADADRLALVSLSLSKLGFLLPLFADANGELLSGHQRHYVAQSLGFTQVPVVFIRAMALSERKAINIAFNRGTNDMQMVATGSSLEKLLPASELQALAASIPDVAFRDTKQAFPCLQVQRLPIAPFIEANNGRWIRYARNLARVLQKRAKVVMPVVATPDYRLVNGLGRLQYAAEQGAKHIDVVWLDAKRAALAEPLLNKLSMDFDLHNRYADVLRHNSFRRSMQVRKELGRGFVFALLGAKPSRNCDLSKPHHASQWRGFYGRSILDFGAGLLHETRMLQSIGVRVTAFEPYLLGKGDSIDRPAALALTRRFLADVAAGQSYTSLFLSSVLNSVPFAKDREHIVCLCAALCGPQSHLYAVASGRKQIEAQTIAGKVYLNENNVNMVGFPLEYEPFVKLGDVGGSPKVQKYHSAAEFYQLFSTFFGQVSIQERVQNVEAIAWQPKPIDPVRLAEAISFEFDLPYPDGQRMGLVTEAKAAFSQRLGLCL